MFSLTKYNLKNEDDTFEYIFLNSVASVYVFHTKSQFTTFYKTKNERLCCGTSGILILGWGEIWLHL